MNERTPLLVLGLGNVLLGDDGAGAAAVAMLRERYQAPPEVLVLDGGTLGLGLLPYLECADSLILVDAVRTGEAAGSLVRLEDHEVGPAVATRLSPHQVGVGDLLDAARWLERYPRRVVLLGVVPESIQLGFGLSPQVKPALPALMASIVNEAAALGFAFRRKPASRPPRTGHGLDLLGLSRSAPDRPDASRLEQP